MNNQHGIWNILFVWTYVFIPNMVYLTERLNTSWKLGTAKQVTSFGIIQSSAILTGFFVAFYYFYNHGIPYIMWHNIWSIKKYVMPYVCTWCNMYALRYTTIWLFILACYVRYHMVNRWLHETPYAIYYIYVHSHGI